MKKSLSLQMTVKTICLLFFTILCINSSPHDDTWRHLALGKLFSSLKGFPATEPFGFPSFDKPFLDISWLTCLVFYKIYRLFHDTGLILLCAFIGSIILFISAGKQKILPTVIYLALVVASIKWRIAARPEIFGFLFFVLTLKELTRLEKYSFLRIYLLITLWTNFHATAFLALLLIGSFLMMYLAQKDSRWRWALYSLIATVFGLLSNPWGIHQLYASVTLGFNPYNLTIFEFQPLPWYLWLHSIRMPLLIFSFFSVFYCFKKRPRECLPHFIIFIFFMITSFRYARALPYPFLIAAPFAIQILDLVLSKTANKIKTFTYNYLIAGTILFSSFIFVLTKPFGLHFEKPDYTKAVDFLSMSPFQGRILNDFNMGGYLMWHGGTRYQLFIDNRSPAYIDTSFRDWTLLGLPGYCSKLVDTLKTNAILMTAPAKCDAPGSTTIVTCYDLRPCYDRKLWALVYWTHSVLLFLRRIPEHQHFIAEHEYRWIDPTPLEPREYGAILEKNLKKPRGKEMIFQELRRALKQNPQDPKALLMYEVTEYLLGQRPLSDIHFSLLSTNFADPLY